MTSRFAHLRPALLAAAPFLLAAIATPVLASTLGAASNPGVSHVFSDFGMPFVDTAINDGLAFAGGPVAILGGLYGLHKTGQALHDAEGTHDYSRKAITGGVATMVASGGIGVVTWLNHKAAQQDASGMVLSLLHHTALLAHHLIH